MRGKIVLTVLLCLATALTVGAAPALAASGCTCHTAVPPTNGAPAAHAPLVVGVDCTTCHTDWVVPHPEGAKAPIFVLRGSSSDTGYKLNGPVGSPGGELFNGHPDVLVYVQQRPWGETAFTDLGQVTTDSKGKFAYTVASPPPFATYRAIASGHVLGGITLFVPKASTLLPRPELAIGIRGFLTGGWGEAISTRLGRTLKVGGTVAPADLGGKVTIRVQKRVQRRWVKDVTVKRVISATGTYSWKWKPRTRGTFRVFVAIPATHAHRGIVVRWIGGAYRTFTVD